MDSNFQNCVKISQSAYLLHFIIWMLFGGVTYSSTFPMFMLFGLLSIFLLCYFLGSNLDEINLLSRAQILDRCLNNYKIGLGCITFCGIAPFASFLVYGMKSMVSSLHFHLCTAALPIILLHIIKPTLDHCNLDSARIGHVADNIKNAFLAYPSIIVPLLVLKQLNLWPNILTDLIFQIVWVLINYPYYIEFLEVMKETPDLMLVGNVRNEDEVATHNYQRTIPDDSDSSDESDEEQHPNNTTNILISSEDLQCNVCFLPYSDRRVPLMLTKCGHSLCKKCCKASQKQFPLSRCINCPFCRTQTPGPISKLPKNYAILGIVQKIGRVE